MCYTSMYLVKIAEWRKRNPDLSMDMAEYLCALLHILYKMVVFVVSCIRFYHLNVLSKHKMECHYEQSPMFLSFAILKNPSKIILDP